MRNGGQDSCTTRRVLPLFASTGGRDVHEARFVAEGTGMGPASPIPPVSGFATRAARGENESSMGREDSSVASCDRRACREMNG